MILPVNLGQDSYDITLERGALKCAVEAFGLKNEGRKVMIVTDDGVPPQYANELLVQCCSGCIHLIPQGEASKNFDILQDILSHMLIEGFTRKDCVAAVGGGVVGDLAGFAAACYMRGIDFYNIPTTLLSQVDSSVGGKTAIDFKGIKNIVGAFHQPKGVLMDPQLLETLDKRQFACGAAEIIKMAATSDASLFEKIEAEGIGTENLESVIEAALRIKIDVVEKDEKEAGLRKALNFGHTLGHGIESCTDFFHGEAVALGMLPMCSEPMRERLIDMLRKANLPVSCSAGADRVIAAAMHDKKAEGDSVSTVQVDVPGSFRFAKCTKEELEKLYKEVFI
ncbi:3-dehydroquinate synthase [Firmicutes bacterium CAG:238]|nr:3-dehydroquinate synthase [Firmicutes bacterium CAG:238]